MSTTTNQNVSSNLLATGLFDTALSLDNANGNLHTLVETFRFCAAALASVDLDVDELLAEALDDESSESLALRERTHLVMNWCAQANIAYKQLSAHKPKVTQQFEFISFSMGRLINIISEGASNKNEIRGLILRGIFNAVEVSKPSRSTGENVASEVARKRRWKGR